MLTQEARISNTEAAQETYLDIEPRLQVWVGWAQSKGVHEHDAQSVAHDAFMAAYLNYSSGGAASFTTYLGNGFKLLLKAATFPKERRRKTKTEYLEEVPLTSSELTHHESRTWEVFRDTLPEDARTVADLAINPTCPILMEYIEKGGHYHNLRTAIRSALKEMGWSVDRIRTAFYELAKALRSE